MIALFGSMPKITISLVSQDSDLADMAALYGAPPKIIWLRCGNQLTVTVEAILRGAAEAIAAFEQDDTAACLIV